MTWQNPTLVSHQNVTKRGTTGLYTWVVNGAPADGTLFQVVMILQAGSTGIAVTAPAGWTTLRATLLTNTMGITVFGKRCELTDPATWTFTSNQIGAGMAGSVVGNNPAKSVPADWKTSTATRTATGTAVTNVAPSVTTTIRSLVLSLSAERTNVTETDAEVIVSAPFTKYKWWPQLGPASDQTSGVETLGFATLDQAAAGATGTSTWTYPGSQASNGWAGLVAVPGADVVPPGTVDPTVGVTEWTGAVERAAGVSVWEGGVEKKVAGPLEFAKGGPHTVDSMIRTDRPFYIAHRGGSTNWPEMTGYAYKASVLAYEMPAIEISVFRSQDGVFICSHDSNTLRVTGQDYVIANTQSSVLLALDVTDTGTDAPPVKPKMARLTDILDLYAATHVIFIEDKSYANGTALLDLIGTYPNPTQHFIWKSFGNGGTGAVTTAHARGYKSWGYFFDGDMPTFGTNHSKFTYVGCDYGSSDATLSAAMVTAGRHRMIGHIIGSTAQRDRMLNLGHIGLMTANVRQITRTPYVSTDPAVVAYLAATGLNASYTAALDGLVKGLKAYGLWSKMNAIYPFVGGTEALHKWNLKDPRDADSAHRLTFTAGVQHSTALGFRANAAPQGGNYADTHLVPSAVLTPDSAHMSAYSLTGLEAADRTDMGAYNWGGGQERFNLIARYLGNLFYYGTMENAGSNVGNAESTGLFTINRTGASAQAGYRNGAVLASNAAASVPLAPVSMFLGALNGYLQGTSDMAFGFASIGAGLTQVENMDLYTVVQNYQTALGRQV